MICIMIIVICFAIMQGLSLNQYDSFNCVLNVPNRNRKLLTYDFSSVPGINKLIDNYKYEHLFNQDEEENMNFYNQTLISNGSKINVEIHLCKYMRPTDEVIHCGNQTLQPPSTCITITKPDNALVYISAFKDMNPVFVSNSLLLKFNSSKGSNKTEPFDIRFKLIQGSLQKTDLISVSGKSITVDWSSKSFFPSDEVLVNDSCIIRTDKKVLDLRPFSGKGYLYNMTNGKQYLLQFCRNLRNPTYDYKTCKDGFAICHVGHSVLAYLNSSQLVYNVHKGFYIKYKLGSKVSQIHFICDSGRITPSIELFSEGPILIFKIFSSLSCFTNNSTCEINIKNNIKYSFERLSGDVHNLIIPSSSNSTYILNICRSLVPTVGLPFTGGNIFAVLDHGNGSIINLGVEQLPPKLDDKKNIIIPFNGSDICSNQVRHNLTIRLICNRLQSKSPEVLRSSNKCVHNIIWETSSVCSSSFKEFDDCNFKGSPDLPSFDFSDLRRPNGDYIIKTTNGSLHINTCGYLNSYTKQKPTAIYINERGAPLVIGRSSKIEIRDGLISSKYVGDPCPVNPSHTTAVIDFVCDNNASDTSPILVNAPSGENNECHFWMKWHTRKACIEQTSGSSGVCFMPPLQGCQFNISDEKNTIYFAVCSGLQGPPAFLCGSNSSVCWISELNEPRVIGFQMEKYIKRGENNFNVTYQNSIATIILEFECSKNHSMINSNVVNLQLNQSVNKKNLLVVKVQTPHACLLTYPTTSTKIDPPAPSSSCQTLQQPIINLNALKGRKWTFDNNNVNLSICSSLPSSPCGPSMGVCEKVDGKYQGFYFSELLQYKPRLPYLNYTGPSSTSLITFPCNHSEVPIKTFIRLDDINSIIIWPTALSCSSEIDSNTDICNNSELSNYFKVYNITLTSKSYLLIALCDSLPLECLVETGSCLIDNSKSPTLHLSLGYPGKSFQDNLGNWIIKFENGAMCNKYGLQYSTVFKFVCDINEAKQKIFHEFNEEKCSYELEVKSVEFCRFYHQKIYEDKLKSDQVKEKDDLNDHFMIDTLPPCSKLTPLRCFLDNLAGVKPALITDDKTKMKYLVEMDLNKYDFSHCGVALCKFHMNKWKPLAKIYNMSYVTLNKTFIIQYKGEEDIYCEGLPQVLLLVKCQDSTDHLLTANNPSISLKSHIGCSIELEWYTEHACIHDENIQELSSSASRPGGHSWSVILVTAILVIVPCVLIFVMRKNVSKFFLRILRQHRFQHCTTHRFSRVNSRLSLSSTSDEIETIFVNPQSSNDSF